MADVTSAHGVAPVESSCPASCERRRRLVLVQRACLDWSEGNDGVQCVLCSAEVGGVSALRPRILQEPQPQQQEN